jgi:O-antigen/teichoic acid export membrane protein
MATNLFKRASSSQLFQNVFSNYTAVVWMGLLSLGLIPVYLRVLGPEQWGIVAICMAIQGFMGLLDAGLGQIMPRDMALASADKASQAHVFALFSRSYMTLGLIGFFVGQLAVPYLIAHWFNNGQGLADGTEWVLRLVIAQFFFQFSNNAHAGYWNGLQEQKTANLRLCFFGTAKHMGALAMVSLWSPHALSYLLPFTVVAALEWAWNRHTIRGGLGDVPATVLVWRDFRALAHNAGLLAAGVLVGMVVSQLDRIVLSRTLDAATYGSYVIVANLGLAFMQLQSPLMRAFFPRVVLASVEGVMPKTRLFSALVLALCVAPCILIAIAAPWVLDAWLANPKMTLQGTTPLRLILCAVAVNAIYNLLYQRIVAAGENRVVIWINVVVFAIIAPTLYLTASVYGAVAGGLAWLASSFLQLAMGGYWLLGLRKSTMQESPKYD